VLQRLERFEQVSDRKEVTKVQSFPTRGDLIGLGGPDLEIAVVGLQNI
jgi:hypothetical protein